MIKRLRRRMTLMVIAVLVLVSAGIVLAIHLSIERNIAAQAESSLAVMAEENSAGRFSRETPPPKPEENENSRSDRTGKNQRGNRGQSMEIRDGKEAAGLGNSYTITCTYKNKISSAVTITVTSAATTNYKAASATYTCNL